MYVHVIILRTELAASTTDVGLVCKGGFVKVDKAEMERRIFRQLVYKRTWRCASVSNA